MQQTQTAAPCTNRRRSPWLRFGTRSLMIATLCLAILLAYVAHHIAQGHRHRQLGERLREAGCSVDFSHYQWIPVQPAMQGTTTSPPGFSGAPMVSVSTLPEWVERSPLAPAFRRIEGVTIRSMGESNRRKTLDHLAELGRVPTVGIYDSGFDLASLRRLQATVEFETLYAPSIQLPRGRLPCLRREGLTWLCVARTQFSNPAIHDLPMSLEYLDATRTRIDDSGLDSFARLPNLETLILRRTPTSAEAIERLRARMPGCRIVWEPLKNL